MFTPLSLHLPDGGNLSRSHQSTAKLKWKSFTIHSWLKQKQINYTQQSSHKFHPPDQLIISTYMYGCGAEHIHVSCAPSSVRARICSCAWAQNCPWPPLSPLTLFNRSRSPSLQLLVKTDKAPACCHMELINRTGGTKRHFNFNTNKETFRIPPNKTPGRGSQDPKPLCVFLKEVWRQIYGGSSVLSSITAVTTGPMWGMEWSIWRHGSQGWNHTGSGPVLYAGQTKAGLVLLDS